MESHEKGTIGDLARYRLEIAKKDLQAAIILMKEQEYRGRKQSGLLCHLPRYIRCSCIR